MESTIINRSNSRLGRLASAASAVELCLDTGSILRLEGGAIGATIQALNGRLWVTRSGDPADYLLESGDQYVIHHKGVVLVQGSPEGKARITPPSAS
jgi:hypothetical protein